MNKILIIEDNYPLAKSIKENLGNDLYKIEVSINGNDGFSKLKRNGYDLLVLDINLPGKSGLDILSELRNMKIDTPILMLTEKKSTQDIVLGLGKGADDYLGKPFILAELKARIDKLLSRPPQKRDEIMHYADLTLYTESNLLKRKDFRVRLKNKEMNILKYFLKYPNRIFTRDQLINNVWTHDTERSPGLIDVYIKRLRDKVDRNFKKKLIKTIHGVGYMLGD